MPSVIETQSQQNHKEADSVRTVGLDVLEDSPSQGCNNEDSDCACESCAKQASIFGQAACVMVAASSHANEKTNRSRLGAQALHWGVLFIGILISLPMVMPTLSPATQEWITSNILTSPGNWKLLTICIFASATFGYGFISRLGRERVLGGCDMLRRLGPAAILGVAWSTIPSFAGVLLVLNMEPIRIALIGDGSNPMQLGVGALIYLIGFVLLAGFGFLPTVSQAILAGYAFGAPMGFALALAGFGGASLIGYEFVGRVARNRVEQEIQRKPKAILLRDALVHANTGRALLLVTLLRASPSAPFALTNLLLASLGVKRGVFFFGTLLGMIPRTLAAVLIGAQITSWGGEIDKPRWMIIAGIVAIVMLIIVSSKVAASALRRVAEHTDTTPESSKTDGEAKADSTIEAKSGVEITSGL